MALARDGVSASRRGRGGCIWAGKAGSSVLSRRAVKRLRDGLRISRNDLSISSGAGVGFGLIPAEDASFSEEMFVCRSPAAGRNA